MAYQQAIRQREGLFLPTKSTHKIELLLLNLQKKRLTKQQRKLKRTKVSCIFKEKEASEPGRD